MKETIRDPTVFKVNVWEFIYCFQMGKGPNNRIPAHLKAIVLNTEFLSRHDTYTALSYSD